QHPWLDPAALMFTHPDQIHWVHDPVGADTALVAGDPNSNDWYVMLVRWPPAAWSPTSPAMSITMAPRPKAASSKSSARARPKPTRRPRARPYRVKLEAAHARVAKLVDARDLKSRAPQGACRFESGPGHFR